MTRTDGIYIDLGQAGEVYALVEYEFQPRERATQEEPGCEPNVSLNRVEWAGVDFLPRFSDAYKLGIALEMLERELSE